MNDKQSVKTLIYTDMEQLVISRLRAVMNAGQGVLELKIQDHRVIDMVFSYREGRERLRFAQEKKGGDLGSDQGEYDWDEPIGA